ncbi:class A beta-lactamase [Pseudarthrobacter chlorophenolicus]|uniref:class A beta-lactamase n=1 Tax=Pseudarthrobacter chlorophenolicus TaxID=85085 RepID=UPI0005F281B7|nr:class A beta-lactamase [Pseudarthrobacter chlorophenolicus]
MNRLHTFQLPEASNQPTRRRALMFGAGGVLAAAVASAAGPASAASGPGDAGRRLDTAISGLESAHGLTIGVAAGRLGQRPAYAYRGGDIFPMCSLFKTLAVARLLRDHAYDDGFWQHRISFRKNQIVRDSVICAADKDRNMSVEELADAALRFSDNTAGNLLLELIGGPPEIGTYARSLGALSTRLDRWEPELNEALPGDVRDTSTPSDIHTLYEALLLGDALGTLGQARLRGWMLRNATSGERLRAAVPPGAELADKTGAGSYGVVNDAGVVWPEDGPPLTLAVMTRTSRPDAVNNNAVVARVGQLVFGELL